MLTTQEVIHHKALEAVVAQEVAVVLEAVMEETLIQQTLVAGTLFSAMVQGVYPPWILAGLQRTLAQAV
jgi:hypothetical protein